VLVQFARFVPLLLEERREVIVSFLLKGVIMKPCPLGEDDVRAVFFFYVPYSLFMCLTSSFFLFGICRTRSSNG
jgi:hypothetical protein